MSADNWTKCPACEKRANEDRQKAMVKAAMAYGKIPADEWRKMTDEATKPVQLEDMFREDYDLGVGTKAGGPFEFFVVYRGSCQECGFSHDFEHRQQLKPT